MLRTLLPSLLLLSFCPMALAQQPCLPASTVEGSVTDQTGAQVPNATVLLTGKHSVTTNASGRYSLSCVASGDLTLEVTAPGFASQQLRVKKVANRAAQVNVRLTVAAIKEEVQLQMTLPLLEVVRAQESSMLSKSVNFRMIRTISFNNCRFLRPAKGPLLSPRYSSWMASRMPVRCRRRTQLLPFASIQIPTQLNTKAPPFLVAVWN